VMPDRPAWVGPLGEVPGMSKLVQVQGPGRGDPG